MSAGFKTYPSPAGPSWQADKPLHQYLVGPFDADESCKIVPLEKGIHFGKTVAPEHLDIFLDTVGHQHVLERFPFARDLDVRIAIAAFELVIGIDHEAVHLRAARKN